MNPKTTKKKGKREVPHLGHSIEEKTTFQSENNAYECLLKVIRGGNLKKIEDLLKTWNKEVHFNLEDALSKACQELKLQNICLCDKVEYLLEKTLLNCRLSSMNVKNDVEKKDIEERISLVMETNAILQLYQNNDEKFIFSLTFITKQLYILKRLLKSTYDRLPWEELEFCIISFVRSFGTNDELNFFYRAILNRQSIIKYLQCFVGKLIQIKDTISNIQLSELSRLPPLKRNQVVQNIKKDCPELEDMYKDYEEIRNMHSLNFIWKYSNLASSVNPTEKKGQLVIIRVLQIIGEHLKNTLESPKISGSMSAHLMLSLNENSRQIVMSLRNSLSHGHSLLKRIELLNNADIDFFKGVQTDVEKIGGIIKRLLFNHKILMIRTLLNRFLDTEDIEEMKEIASTFKYLHLFAIINNVKLLKSNDVNKLNKLRPLMENLSKILHKSSETTLLLQRLEYLLKDPIDSSDFSMNYVKGLTGLLGLHEKLLVSLKNEHNRDNSVRTYKFLIKQYLGYFTPSERHDSNSEILRIILSIYKNTENENNAEVTRLVDEMVRLIILETDDISWVEKFERRLDNKKSEFMLNQFQKGNKINYKQQLQLKFKELRNLLSTNSNDSVLTYSMFKKDQVIQVAVEALLLDIYSIIDVTQKSDRSSSVFFLDSPHTSISGKNLRNHLAHYNALNEILFNPTLSSFINVEMLIEHGGDISTNLNNVRKYTYTELKKQFNDALLIITRKQEMFTSLQTADIDNIKALLAEGANIESRDINLSTSMHFASKNYNISMIKYLHNEQLDFEAKNLSLETPLHIAASSGNTECVKYILNLKCDTANDKNDFWSTPLHRAAYNGHTETIKVLMKQKTSLYETDMMCFTALHYAVLSGNQEAVKLFFSDNIDRRIDTALGGLSALHIASESGLIDMVKFLLSKNVKVNAKSDIGGTSIHIAAFYGHLEVVELLIKAGADVNSRNCSGLTPLHHACEKGFESVVEALLKHGADIDPKDHESQYTPLHYVTKDGHLGIVKILLSYKADVNSAITNGATPLHFAAEGRHLEIVKVLVKHPGINMNSEDMRYFTPLHIAADNGDVDIGRTLIENGAQFEQVSINESPLHLAAKAGHEDFVRMLLDVGATINLRNSSGYLPIHSAAESGNIEIINMLLAKGADINSKTDDGSNCLHIAARHGKNIVGFLVNNGINVNLKTKTEGFSPLHDAVGMNHVDIIRSLIEARVDVNCQDIVGNTVLHMAVSQGFEDIVEILLEKNASINIKNKIDKSPLHFAIQKNQLEIVRILNSHKSLDLSPEYLEMAAAIGNVKVVKTLLGNPIISTNKSSMNQALLYASTMGHTQVVDLLIQKGALSNNLNCDFPPLIAAVSQGSEDIVETLLVSGADVNSTDLEGSTALHIVAKKGNLKIVQLLLDQGARLDILDKKNRLPIELAAAEGHVAIFKLLFERGQVDINRKGNDDFTFMHIAVQFGHLEMVDYLISKGANMHSLNNMGSKPIHIAAREGFPEIIQLFLDKGMNINERGRINNSLLHYAAYAGQLKVLEFLIDQKLEINSINLLGHSALDMACSHSQKECAEYLLNNGSIFNRPDIYRRTAKDACKDLNIEKLFISLEKLFNSMKLNNVGEIQDLVRRGVILNAIDEQKGTPLHFAVYKGLDEVVKIFLDNGASPNLSFKNGWTALHYASKFDRSEIVQLLLSYGAKFDVPSDTGKTPIDFAENGSIKNLLQLIKDCFSSIHKGNEAILHRLDKIKDLNTIRAIMNAQNAEGQNLITFAIAKNFKKIEKLKCVSQPDVEKRLDLAEILFVQENYQEALKIYCEMYDQRRILLGNNNPATLEIQTKISDVYYKQQKYQQALNIYENIYKEQVKNSGISSEPALSTRSKIALVLHRQGKNENALTIFEEVHEKQRKILKKDDQDLLSTKCHMALVLNNLSKFEEALKLNREVLKLQITKFGRLNPVTLSTKNNIAMVLANQGEYDEAVKIYEEVYEDRAKVLGPYHSDTMRCLHNKIRILTAQKKHEESLKALQQLYVQQKHHLGLKHRDTLNTGISISHALQFQGKIISAYKVLAEIRDNLREILGCQHPDVLGIEAEMNAMSEHLRMSGVTFHDMDSFLDNLQISMYKASKEGDISTIEGILKSGVDVDQKDKDGRTALHFAVDSCDLQMINFLLTNGARITETTNMENSVLHIACTKGSLKIVDFLINHLTGTDLHRFINIQTNSGKSTALHVAAKKNNVEIVKLLLRKGAIYNIKNKDHRTPADLSQNIDIITILKLITDIFNEVEKKSFDVISNKLKDMNQEDFLCVANARDVTRATLTMFLISSGGKNLASTILTRLKDGNA